MEQCAVAVRLAGAKLENVLSEIKEERFDFAYGVPSQTLPRTPELVSSLHQQFLDYN